MRDPRISEPDQEIQYPLEAGSLKFLPPSSHSYSDRFATFNSFNSFSVDNFDFELAFHRKTIDLRLRRFGVLLALWLVEES